MFTPSQHDVRTFFCESWRKRREGVVATPLETMAADWISEHPEYQADLSDVDAAPVAVYDVEAGRTNPFLHLSMHLTIEEQIGIDQPRGIRQAYDLLRARLGSAHDAQHEVMECLGQDGVGVAAQRPPARWRCLHRLRAPARHPRLSRAARLRTRAPRQQCAERTGDDDGSLGLRMSICRRRG